MALREYIKRIFTVRKCVCCRSILSVSDFEEAFCPECDLSWQRAKTENCPECYGAASECSCMPKQLSSAGALTLRRLFFYSAKRENEPQNRLVYYLKHHKSKRAADFCAAALVRAAKEEAKTLGVDIEDFLVVSMPRGRRAVSEYGFDQSEEICEALAQRLGAKYCSALGRKFGGREQKKLNAAQRKKNIANLIYVRDDMSKELKGRYVLLFDDVVTTGASLSVCVSLLRRAGVKGVVCLTLASDIKKEISASR